MHVRPIDIHDDAEVGAWWDVSRRADAHGRENLATHWSLRAAIVALRSETNPMRNVPLAAYEGGRIVGIDLLHYPVLDNTHLAYVATRVLPDCRRQGIGTALLRATIELAREAGRSTIVAELTLPIDDVEESGHLKFARRHGFELGILDLHRVLALPVSDRLLDTLERDAATDHADYTLVSWEDVVADEHLDGYCKLQAAFNNEAPAGELHLEEEVWDAERVRTGEERRRRQGRQENVTVALDADGTMVGLTEMMSTTESPHYAMQGGTLVLPSARGHRLGIAMKVANLRRFQSRFPECRSVHSWNAEENGPMVAINDALGFRPVERLAEMQMRLGTS